MNMKKKSVFFITVLMTTFAIIDYAFTANRVVVVPLNSSNNNGQYVSAESSFTWDDPSGLVITTALTVACPNNCIAVNGDCGEKISMENAKITFGQSYFSKTNDQLSYFDAYECRMLATNDSSDPPVGYAQVICYCQ